MTDAHVEAMNLPATPETRALIDALRLATARLDAIKIAIGALTTASRALSPKNDAIRAELDAPGEMVEHAIETLTTQLAAAEQIWTAASLRFDIAQLEESVARGDNPYAHAELEACREQLAAMASSPTLPSAADSAVAA